MLNPKDFKQKQLRKLKEASGLTDSELARQAGISRQRLWRYLNLDIKNPSHDVIKGLTRALGCSESDLVA